eukprot:gnl/Dysnectes_brevis/880_a975_4828.p1 GENE.gnl/Dysnectes_brevis/880_a975_4828~~gnl/Dysnectes_brevis/880_a975_4828.p1  ORF type:complete len:184 (+),score=4.00 gnl/Dysnectes_brevis/880_a975_4828:63-614(+)
MSHTGRGSSFSLEERKALFKILLDHIMHTHRRKAFKGTIDKDLLESLPKKMTDLGYSSRTSNSLRRRFKRDWQEVSAYRRADRFSGGAERPSIVNCPQMYSLLQSFIDHERLMLDQVALTERTEDVIRVVTDRVVSSPKKTLKAAPVSSTIRDLKTKVDKMFEMMTKLIEQQQGEQQEEEQQE